jgi:hypothetical protein
MAKLGNGCETILLFGDFAILQLFSKLETRNTKLLSSVHSVVNLVF